MQCINYVHLFGFPQTNFVPNRFCVYLFIFICCNQNLCKVGRYHTEICYVLCCANNY